MRKKVIELYLILFFLSTLIASCTSEHPNTPTISPTSTEFVAQTTEPVLKLETPIPTLTTTPSPTSTENPLATPDISSKSFLELSPNNQWAVFYDMKDSGGLKIISVDGQKQYDIYFSEITGIPCPPCGNARVAIAHWSPDSQFLYVSPVDGGDGGWEHIWRSKSKLIQFSLITGDWIDTQMGVAFSFSPNDEFLAYRQKNELVIFEFKTKEEMSILISDEYQEFGQFVWSPNSQNIIFTAGETNQPNYIDGWTLFLLDINNMTIKIIVENDLRYLYPIEWDNNDNVELISDFSSEYFQMSVSTYKIIPLDSQ